MKLLNTFLDKLPNGDSCVMILSGGMDSAIASRLCVEKYGKNNVYAINYFYQQKQYIEMDKAKEVADILGISLDVIDISFLGDISRSISSNIQGGKEMPTIQDILGDPTPTTYVPSRNAILMLIAAAYAESRNVSIVVAGFQNQDQYSYYDTSQTYLNSINDLLNHARTRHVNVYGPFVDCDKATEIRLLRDMDNNLDLLKHTMTCYNSDGHNSCGVCPSCSERIAAFIKNGIVDPVPYNIDIKWS